MWPLPWILGDVTHLLSASLYAFSSLHPACPPHHPTQPQSTSTCPQITGAVPVMATAAGGVCKGGGVGCIRDIYSDIAAATLLSWIQIAAGLPNGPDLLCEGRGGGVEDLDGDKAGRSF